VNKQRVLFAVLSFFGAIGASSASASNGIQHYEDGDVIPAFYIACLGETVKYEYRIYGSFHIFETPSGNFHLLDNWKFTVMMTGNDSGRTWYGGGPSPYQQNIGPGETLQYTANYKAKPLTGDGPTLKFRETFKLTVNAEGELVVEMYNLDGVDLSEVWQCNDKK